MSVLIACFNGSAWLQDSIDSVLRQTFGDFELILVDDGSTDGSVRIMEQTQQSDDRVTLIRKEHSGLTDSLNSGLDIAKGRWIARIDSDDRCEPNRLAQQVAYVRRNNVVLVGSGFVEIDVSGRIINDVSYPSDHRALVRRLLRSRGFFPHSSAFFNRDVALRVGSYNTRFLKSQDRDLWLRLSECGKLGCIRGPLVQVRKHAQSISNSANGYSQFVYGTAASVCFILRFSGAADPSTNEDSASWDNFLGWVADNPETKEAVLRRRSWAEARARFFGQENRLRGLWAFTASLLTSGTAMPLVREKICGLSLPGKLASDWLQKSCAAS